MKRNDPDRGTSRPATVPAPGKVLTGSWWVLALTSLHLLTPSALGSDPSATKGQHPGEPLARALCQTCHLFPEPELLDKQTWAKGAFRKMAPFLGVARLNYERMPDGAILKESGLFPESPILSEADWRAITAYFLEAAPASPLPQGPRPPIQSGVPGFRAEPVSLPGVAPAVTLVKIDPRAQRIFLGDAQNLALHTLDSQGKALRHDSVPSAPVALTSQGPTTLVTLIGHVFPSDARLGQIVAWPYREVLSSRPLIGDLQRPVDCAWVDLNADGQDDLVVAEFGNNLGRLAWFEHPGAAHPVRHLLSEFPGATRIEVTDIDTDGDPDLVVLMAQAWEGVYLFRNLGRGEFERVPLLQFPPVYGSTSFEFVDFNGDGFRDLLVTHGDNGEYASPFKRYHGVRLFLNDGSGQKFTEAWFFPMNGAFKAIARDFDGDGDLDIAAISFFPDYSRSPEESFVYLENDGSLNFTPYSLPEATAGRWLTMDAGDLDADGDLDLVLGSFIDGPRAIPIPTRMAQRWHTEGIAALVLRNGLSGPPGARPRAAAPPIAE